MNESTHQRVIQRFKETFLVPDSDIDGFMELVDKDCEWVLLATGETFRGTSQIRQLAERSKAARTHSSEIKMEPTTLFATEDYFVIEYTHNAIATANWTTPSNKPAPGEILRIPICIVAHFKGEKFDRIHEYFDLLTVSGKQGKLYS
jgi:ketosteroid isomerase-like protein